jgi:hypothetical protein
MSNSNAASPRDPPSPPSSHIAHAPEPSTARPQLPQANTLTESHSTLHHQNVRPHLHFALLLAAWMIQWHFSNLRALAGRHLPFADTDRRRNQAPPTVGCNLWLLPVASWSSTIPLVHCSPRPRLCPYPRACCCFLPALPCSPRFLRCWPLSRAGNAREKAQSLF